MYKGDWRVKEYKDYTEELERENERLTNELVDLKHRLRRSAWVLKDPLSIPTRVWDTA